MSYFTTIFTPFGRFLLHGRLNALHMLDCALDDALLADDSARRKILLRVYKAVCDTSEETFNKAVYRKGYTKMSYTRERDEFIKQASQEGLDLDACRKLLRYATTLQRLAEAQCNGDWPYNGDRDRPIMIESASVKGDARDRWDKRYTVCPKCEASGVARAAMRWSRGQPPRMGAVIGKELICPDCRTQELVNALLGKHCYCKHEDPKHECTCGGPYLFKPIFQGDPRGAVLKLATPGYPWSDDGRLGYGLYVPARGTRYESQD